MFEIKLELAGLGPKTFVILRHRIQPDYQRYLFYAPGPSESDLSRFKSQTPGFPSFRVFVQRRARESVEREIGVQRTRSNCAGSAKTDAEGKDEAAMASWNAIAQRQWWLWKLSLRSYYLTTTFLVAILATSENYSSQLCYLDICSRFPDFAQPTSAVSRFLRDLVSASTESRYPRSSGLEFLCEIGYFPVSDPVSTHASLLATTYVALVNYRTLF